MAAMIDACLQQREWHDTFTARRNIFETISSGKIHPLTTVLAIEPIRAISPHIESLKNPLHSPTRIIHVKPIPENQNHYFSVIQDRPSSSEMGTSSIDSQTNSAVANSGYATPVTWDDVEETHVSPNFKSKIEPPTDDLLINDEELQTLFPGPIIEIQSSSSTSNDQFNHLNFSTISRSAGLALTGKKSARPQFHLGGKPLLHKDVDTHSSESISSTSSESKTTKTISFSNSPNASDHFDDELSDLDENQFAQETQTIILSAHQQHALDQMNADKKIRREKTDARSVIREGVAKETAKSAGNFTNTSASIPTAQSSMNQHDSSPLSAHTNQDGSRSNAQGPDIQSATNGAAFIEHILGAIANWWRRKDATQDIEQAKELLTHISELERQLRTETAKEGRFTQKIEQLQSQLSGSNDSDQKKFFDKQIKYLQKQKKDQIQSTNKLGKQLKKFRLAKNNAHYKLEHAKKEKNLSTLAFGRYSAQAITVSGLSIPRLAMDAHNVAPTATNAMSGTSGLAMGSVALVAAPLATYAAIQDANSARKANSVKKTAQKFIQLTTNRITKKLSSTGEVMHLKEICAITRMVEKKQAVRFKWLSCIGNFFSAGGYLTLGAAGTLNFAIAIGATTGIAAIPIVGWALAGIGASIGLGLAIYRYVKHRQHCHEKQQLIADLNGKDSAKAQAAHLQLLSCSGKYAVHYLTSHLRDEVNKVKNTPDSAKSSEVCEFLNQFMSKEELDMLVENIIEEQEEGVITTHLEKYIARKLNLPIKVKYRETQINLTEKTDQNTTNNTSLKIRRETIADLSSSYAYS